MQSRQAGSHIVLILVIVAVVGVAGLIGWRLWQTNKGGSQGEFASQYPCTERNAAFTSPPLKMEDLGYIRPMGAMLDGHVTPTDHVYVGPAKSDVPDNTYPVLMPANGTVVQVGRMPDQYIGDRSGTTLAPEDHRIIMTFNCQYSSIYIHIHKLSDAVKQKVGSIKPNENKDISLELKAGDVVGYIGGSTFDWTAIDAKSKLTGYITPDLYKRESWKINTVSPFDLYTGELKTQMEAKSIRSVPPIGGKIDYDQPGKLIGNWFRSGTNGYAGADQERYWDGHLAVVPDYIDPTYSIVSIGNWQGSAAQFAVKDRSDPATVSVQSGMVKYELVKLNYSSTSTDPNIFTKGMHPDLGSEFAGTIAFQVEAGEKLKVEKFPGKHATEVTSFTAAAQTYER